MNWGQIKDAVRSYAHRTDITDALMSTFVELAEQRIYMGEQNTPKLRCDAMLCKAQMYYGTRPSDFLEAKKIYPLDCPDKPLNFAPNGLMPGACNSFSWEGQELVLSKDQAFPVEMLFYSRFMPLVNDDDCNWLSDHAPAIYLSAIGVEVGDWMRDPEFAASQASKYTSSCASLVSSDRASAISGSPLTIRRR